MHTLLIRHVTLFGINQTHSDPYWKSNYNPQVTIWHDMTWVLFKKTGCCIKSKRCFNTVLVGWCVHLCNQVNVSLFVFCFSLSWILWVSISHQRSGNLGYLIIVISNAKMVMAFLKVKTSWKLCRPSVSVFIFKLLKHEENMWQCHHKCVTVLWTSGINHINRTWVLDNLLCF